MATGVRIEGLRETVRTLEKYGVATQDLKAAFTKIGNLVVADAKILAPSKTGRLIASIKASKTKNRSVVRAGSARVVYAGVIHYGWPAHNIKAHPFLSTAAARKQAEAVRVMEEELDRLASQLGLK